VRDGVNPYAGYLAHADRIVVTPDSVNMLSEACATGKPIFTHLTQGRAGKLAALHATLRAQGRLHDLAEANISTLAPVPPLRETAAVAEQVWQRFRASQSPPQQESAS
jgi:mitochondrial fission protein ELM1